MVNHKSSLKRMRQDEGKRVENKYYAKTTRNTIQKLRNTTDKKEASELLPKMTSLVDKLVKKNVIHKKKADNLKSKLAKRVNSL